MRTVLLLLAALASTAPQRQTFKTNVDLVAVDVTIVDNKGNPIPDLKLDDFEVRISQGKRRVVTVERLTYGAPAPMASAKPAPAVVPATDPAQTAAPGAPRRFVLAVDEHSLQAASALAAVNAAERFIDKLQPDDLVGLYAYPTGTAKHDLTTDHASVRKMLRNIAGLQDEPASRFRLSVSEIIDIASGDKDATQRAFQRECRGTCMARDIEQEAISQAGFIEMTVSQSVAGLRGLVRGLAAIPGRKVVVLVSGGLISSDRTIGRANSSAQIAVLGREAAVANLELYALHLDWSFQQALSKGLLRPSALRDSGIAATGLEMVAGTAGGAVIRVPGTSPDVAFDRVLRETSAYYILGVEAAEEDRDGRPHQISVKVKRKGADVRSRAEVTIPRR